MAAPRSGRRRGVARTLPRIRLELRAKPSSRSRTNPAPQVDIHARRSRRTCRENGDASQPRIFIRTSELVTHGQEFLSNMGGLKFHEYLITAASRLMLRIGGNSYSTSPCPGSTRRDARSFLANRSGISAVEFAALLPLFVGLVFMIAQVGLYLYFSATLYYVTEKATRQILTGSVANQGLTAAQFRANILCPLLPLTMSCANIVTNIQVVPDTSGGASYWYNLTNYTTNPSSPVGYTLTGLNTPPMNNNNTSFCIGAAGSIVATQVYYAMPVVGIPQMLVGSSNFNGQSVIFINATAVFKNEPFSTTYTGC